MRLEEEKEKVGNTPLNIPYIVTKLPEVSAEIELKKNTS